MTVYFGVKYYASDPCKLAEEITRYQFFLQCKQDILHSRLPISFELAIELFALAVQSELGDYDPQRHHDGYVSEFQFLPNQTIDLEKRVALFHRQLTGQVPATAELNFLERVKWLDLYGCQLHPIQYEENCSEEYALGLNPSGVLVLRNKLKVAHYLWPRIIKTKCQGRCFLMDVIDNKSNNNSATTNERNRFGFRLLDKMASRRLRWAIEEHKSFYHLIHSSATLNQLRQQQQQQHQQVKLSQRFRNSIRSAINVGSLGGMAANLQLAQQQHLLQQHQQQKLRSSVKSLNNQALIQQQAAYGIDSRAPPTVVRMPSRRYSNRSLTRTSHQQQYLLPTSASANGNGLPNVPNGASSQTMVESQRQQAIMMMNQFNQMNNMIGKSQTLKPMPVSAKLEAKEAKKNPYYQMMMMMASNNNSSNGNSNNGHHLPPDIAILPPGRHIVQPSIYKSSSVLNGVNHLGASTKDLHQAGVGVGVGAGAVAYNGQAMMQFFNTKPQYPGLYHSSGHESPRSTKSAIAPSSAIKLASKKLAKQQLLYANQHQDTVQPILAYDPISLQHQQQVFAAAMAAQTNNSAADYYGVSMPFNLSTSANPSPRSVRSARLTRHHKSKSTNENLHLLHNTSNHYLAAQQPHLQSLRHQSGLDGANKMLLATTQQLMQQQQQQQHHNLPPPGYGNKNSSSSVHKQRHIFCSDNESEISKLSKPSSVITKKRATFALNSDQANLLLNTNGLSEHHNRVASKQAHMVPLHHRTPNLHTRPPSDGEEDYCCSRSDCSSIDDGSGAQNRKLDYNNRSARLVNNGTGQGNLMPPAHQRRLRRTSVGSQQEKQSNPKPSQQQQQSNLVRKPAIDDQEEWNAIRKRHSDFSNGKGFIHMNIDQGRSRQLDHSLVRSSSRDANQYHHRRHDVDLDDEDDHEEPNEDDVNNNMTERNSSSNQLVKSIANKQATPILLSLNYDQTNANNKAVQLLNLQRQQLNSQSSDTGTKSSSSALDSAPSSVASSPQATSAGPGSNQTNNQQVNKLSGKTTDSTASNSTTTSGYYAGSNSTGSASVDSDSQTTVDGHQPLIGGNKQQQQQQNQSGKVKSASSNNNSANRLNKQNGYSTAYNDWQEENKSRSKISAATYTGMAGDRLLIGNQGHLKNAPPAPVPPSSHDLRSTQRNNQPKQKQKQFYLGEGGNHSSNEDCQTNNQTNSQASQRWSPLNQIPQHGPSSLKYVSFDV